MNVLRYAANFLGLEVTDAYAANTFDAVYPHSQNAILQRQDQCVQAFGDAYTSNICTPGNTLCCEQAPETNQSTSFSNTS